MQARNEPMAKMRLLNSTRDGDKKSFDSGAISVHWPQSEGSLQESWRISAVLLPPPATRTRCLSPPACSSSIPGRSQRPSCISFSFRHRHAPSPPPDAPAAWVSSSAHRRVSDEKPFPPTTRTASGLLCKHNADAPYLAVGMLGSSIHLQEKIMTYYILSLI